VAKFLGCTTTFLEWIYLHGVLGVVVDRPEPVAASGVVSPAAGDALVAGWLGSGLAVGGVVDVVVDVG